MARPLPNLLLLISLASLPGFRGLPAIAYAKPVQGPQMPPSARTLIAVKATVTRRYIQDDVVAARGIRMGTRVDEDHNKRAALWLGETGVVNDIRNSNWNPPLV